ncbi:MAG TPA: acyl carrier protein [Steroidobacteraceae bacterium]
MSVNVKSREEILEYLREVLVELFEVKPEQVVPEANLYEDLDIDSIDAVDLILKLKELTGRKIQPQQFKHVRTINDVIEAIQSVMAESPAA